MPVTVDTPDRILPVEEFLAEFTGRAGKFKLVEGKVASSSLDMVCRGRSNVTLTLSSLADHLVVDAGEKVVTHHHRRYDGSIANAFAPDGALALAAGASVDVTALRPGTP